MGRTPGRSRITARTLGDAVVVDLRRYERQRFREAQGSKFEGRLGSMLGGVTDGSDPRVAHAVEMFSRAPYSLRFAVVGRSVAGAKLRLRAAGEWGRFGLRDGVDLHVVLSTGYPNDGDLILSADHGAPLVTRFRRERGDARDYCLRVPVPRPFSRADIVEGFAIIKQTSPNDVPGLRVGQDVTLCCQLNGWRDSAFVEKVYSAGYHFRLTGRRESRIVVNFESMVNGAWRVVVDPNSEEWVSRGSRSRVNV